MKRRPNPKPPAAKAASPATPNVAPIRGRYGSVKQIATHYGVSERHVRRLIANKDIPSIKVGGAIRIPWDGLDEV